MQYQLSENILTVNLEGKIDTNNADEISAELLELAQKFPTEKFILNLEKLNYISSAGLRAVLKLSKIKKNNLQLVEASREVYEVFDISGFTKILNIQKALRKISADNLIELGRGTSGTIYKLDDENILKVYKENWSFEDVARERANSQAAFVAGINTAISYDVVKVGKNFGIVYEMINANTLEKIILDNIDDIESIESHSRRFAEFIKKQHAIKTDFPDIRQRIISIAEKTPIYSAKDLKIVRQIVENVPECKNFCHGDLNLANILLQDGQLIMIDMGEIASGHPVFDLSWIYFIHILRKKAVQNPEIENKKRSKLLPDAMWKTFLQTYFNTTDEKDIAHYERTILPYGLIMLLNATKARVVPKMDRDFSKNTLLAEFERGIVPIDF